MRDVLCTWVCLSVLWKSVSSLGCNENVFIIFAMYPLLDKILLKAPVKGLLAKGVSIRFHFISKISCKLGRCMHICTLIIMSDGDKTMCYFLSLYFKPDSWHLFPLAASSGKKFRENHKLCSRQQTKNSFTHFLNLSLSFFLYMGYSLK